MHVSSLFFIVIIAVVCLFGGIMAAGTYQANNPISQPDSLGKMPNQSTNTTSAMVSNVTAFESQGSGWMVLLIALFTIICVVVGGALTLRGGNFGRGKYRT